MSAEDDFDIYGDTNFEVVGGEGAYAGDDDSFNIYGDTSSHSRDEDIGKGISSVVFNEEVGVTSPRPLDEEVDIPLTPAIYLGNLAWWTTDQQIEDLLSEFGKVKSLKFFEDKVNGKSKGYAFVDFLSLDSARQAKEKLSGKEINDKPMLVNYVSPSNYRQLTAPSGTGGRGATLIPGMPPMPRPPYVEGRGRSRGDGIPRGRGRGYGGQQGPPFYQGGRGYVHRGGYRGYPRGGGFPFAPGRGMMVAPHVNPAFFFPGQEPPGDFRGGYRGDRDEEMEDRHRKRDREDERDRERDRGHRDRDREYDRERGDRDRDYDRDRDRDREYDRDRDRDEESRSRKRREKDRAEDRERR